MMVYGNFLTKLPFVGEKSFIVWPVLALQDYSIKRWKENLPGDDAEKYADWYVFRLMMYIASDRIYLYMKYNMDEVKKINEKAWETIENIVKFEAKDKAFQEIRLAAFNNSSVIFAKNVLVNWSDIENKNGQTSVSIERKNIAKRQTARKTHKTARIYKIYERALLFKISRNLRQNSQSGDGGIL